MHRRRPILAALAASAILVAFTVGSALATYPGAANGRIAFAMRAADGKSAQVYTVLPNGKGLKRLTKGSAFNLCPAYSADGKRIAWCGNATGSWEIWSMWADGSHQHQVTHLGGSALFPDWSPDGKRIVFSGTEGADQTDQIYVVASYDGTGLTRLTSCDGQKAGCANDYPAWSPDGTKIAFIHADDTDADGNAINAQVWVMDADGTHAHALTTDPAHKDELPDWSPDGTRIAYESGDMGSGGIWVMNADGSDPHQLTGCRATDPSPCPAGDDFGAAWSPDGTKIAFVRDFRQTASGAERAEYVMNADGSGQHRLIASKTGQLVPGWQPIGTRATH